MTPMTLPPAPTGAPFASSAPVASPQTTNPEDTAVAQLSFDAVCQTIAKSAPSRKAAPQSPMPVRARKTSPSNSMVAQILAPIMPKPDSAPAIEDDINTPSAPVFPALPDTSVTALLAIVPPPPVALAAPVTEDAPAIRSTGAATVAADAMPLLFFTDDPSSATDPADFAEDLIAALTPATSSLVADTKTLAKVDAPVLVDPRPKLDVTSDAWLDQLAKDISASATSDGKLSFRIVPPQLGRLDIAIETRDAGVAVHVKAETREAHLLIANAQHRLEEALGTQGVRVTETSVTSNGGGDLPRPHFMPQNPLIEAVTETKREADAPTTGRDAGRFA